jgi:transcriptional regulator with XRE-family HTH domain
MNAISNTWRKLRNKKYRDAFVAAQLKRGIPFQIQAMRKKLGWSQEQLAEAAGLTQGVVSRAENPNYGNLTFNTVLKIAHGLDMAFVGWFVPFSKLTDRFETLSEESVQVPTFKEEDKALSDNETREDRTITPSPGLLSVSGGTVGSIENSTPTPSQTVTTEKIMETLIPDISAAQKAARGISHRNTSSSEQEPTQEAA